MTATSLKECFYLKKQLNIKAFLIMQYQILHKSTDD